MTRLIQQRLSLLRYRADRLACPVCADGHAFCGRPPLLRTLGARRMGASHLRPYAARPASSTHT
jgi:hypothetical protein